MEPGDRKDRRGEKPLRKRRRAKQIAATADRAQVEAQLDAMKMGFLSWEGLGPREG